MTHQFSLLTQWNTTLQELEMNASINKKNNQSLAQVSTLDVLPCETSSQLTIAEQVIDYARWAPSGDNTQPWIFKLHNEYQFFIEATDTRAHCVYDLDGHSSHLAHGILLETINIAASQLGYEANFLIDDANNQLLIINVQLKVIENVSPTLLKDNQHLFPFIKTRAVQRRSMGTKKLSSKEKDSLINALPEGFSITFFESFSEKLACAKLNYINAKTRLTMEEAFNVHREIIEWNSKYSETKIPEQALGVDWLTARAMQWMFKDWHRVNFANKYLGAALIPRIILDFIPGLRSNAHFVIYANQEPKTVQEHLSAGQAIQRFWLTVAQLNLGLQPSQTSIIFAKYLRNKTVFTLDDSVIANARKAKEALETVIPHSERAVFVGRLGRTELPRSRSIRKSLSELIINR